MNEKINELFDRSTISVLHWKSIINNPIANFIGKDICLLKHLKE